MLSERTMGVWDMGKWSQLKEIEIIYGAKSIALCACRAIQALIPENRLQGFAVTSREGNPQMLAGLPVWELGEITDRSTQFLIATPENIHGEIAQYLEKNSFRHYICLSSGMENALMEAYYQSLGRFPSLHALETGDNPASIQAYMVQSAHDKPLSRAYEFPAWVAPLQVGAALSGGVSGLRDDTGENISEKNRLYCELTALYWIWKNGLEDRDYYGLFHYRRQLELTPKDLFRLGLGEIDVVLPFPRLHEPDMREHHTRYVKDGDWDAMLRALKELRPEYFKAFQEISKEPYLYNYNIMVAKRQVWEDYCSWLFPVLKQIELERTGQGRADRYIGYLAENLLTVYFRFHETRLNIAHTGCLMLT